MYHSRGLGLCQPADTIFGMSVPDYCSSYLRWITSPCCFQYTPSAWSQMSQFQQQAATIPQPSPPPAVTSTGVSETVPPTVSEAQQAIDTSLSQAAGTTQANIMAAFKNMIPVADSSGFNWWVAGGVIAAFLLLLAYSGSRGYAQGRYA